MPFGLKALLEEPESIDEEMLEWARRQIEERDDYEALEAAVQDLERLDRYESRAWTRQKRAIRQLICLKLAKRYANSKCD